MPTNKVYNIIQKFDYNKELKSKKNIFKNITSDLSSCAKVTPV